MIHRPRIVAALAGLTAMVLLAAGCAEQDPTGVELQPAGGLQVGSVAHPVIAPTMFHSASYSRVIDGRGGVLHFGIGSLTFPPGALSQPTVITARTDGVTVAAAFGPHGLVFPAHSSPTLTFVIPLAASISAKGSVYYVDSRNVVLEDMGASFASEPGTVQTSVRHFSKFIFGAN